MALHFLLNRYPYFCFYFSKEYCAKDPNKVFERTWTCFKSLWFQCTPHRAIFSFTAILQTMNEKDVPPVHSAKRWHWNLECTLIKVINTYTTLIKQPRFRNLSKSLPIVNMKISSPDSDLARRH